jgi:hypothetical protein
MFAAIGIDGIRKVVWGIGATEVEAREDASRYLGAAEALELDCEAISEAQAQLVRNGDVSWPY